jgi:hypothetical protein
MAHTAETCCKRHTMYRNMQILWRRKKYIHYITQYDEGQVPYLQLFVCSSVLFNGPVNILYYVALNLTLVVEKWTTSHWNKSIRYSGIIPEIMKKPQQSPVRTTQSERSINTSVEPYHYINLLGKTAVNCLLYIVTHMSTARQQLGKNSHCYALNNRTTIARSSQVKQ